MYLYNRKAPLTYYINVLFPTPTFLFWKNPQPSEFLGPPLGAARPNGEEVLEVSEAAEAGHVCMYIWSPPQDLART